MKLKIGACFALFLISSFVQAQKIAVNNKGKVGFTDSSGALVINYNYDSATPFNNGVSIVSKSGKYGLIDQNGKTLLSLSYSSISEWTEDIFLIKSGKKMGLADRAGNIILAPKYSNITRPNCYGKALIAVGGKLQPVSSLYVPTGEDKNSSYLFGAKYGIIDNQGNICIKPTYKGLYEFSQDMNNCPPYGEGLALKNSCHPVNDTLTTNCELVGFNSTPFGPYNAGILDGNGNVLLKSGLYSTIMHPKNGMVRYYKATKKKTTCGYHNLTTGKSLVVSSFMNPAPEDLTMSHGDFADDIAPIFNNTWSFIDKDGNTLKADYKEIRHSANLGLWAALKTSGTWDVFDNTNKEVPALSGFQDILFPVNKDDAELFVVCKDAKYGVINKDVAEVVPFEYEKAMSVICDVVPVKKAGKCGLLSISAEEIIPCEFAEVILPIEKEQKHYWVRNSDGLYYHYNASNGTLSSIGYKNISNFVQGLALVVTTEFKVEDTTLNKAQALLPNASQSDIESVDIDKVKNMYGYLLNTDDEIVLNRPISSIYADKARTYIQKLGNRKLTDGEAKNLILTLTKENRIYSLKDTLSEDDWNY